MKYAIWDLETTIHESYKRLANPFDSRNKPIVSALLVKGEDPALQYDRNGIDKIDIPYDDIDYLVGHNIKFDLLYLWPDPDFQSWLAKGGQIWDTQTAEYLLTGQRATYSSLNECAEKYGGTLKDDAISAYFKAGIGSEDIPPEELLPYAENDVINTEIVLLSQAKEARKLGMMNILLVYMEHYLALCEMENNGLFFDSEKAAEIQESLEGSLESLESQVHKHSAQYWTDKIEFNPDSEEHVSAILFNGEVTSVEDVPALDSKGREQYYGEKAQKAGQLKTRKEKVKYKVEGFGVPFKYQKTTKKEGIYSSDKKILDEIRFATKRDELKEFIDVLLEYRETSKYLHTYLYAEKQTSKNSFKETGLIPLVHADGCIHHTLDCVQTKTGRLNSRNPNSQNIPRDLRTLFTSRYGKNGTIICADFSQLEVCVQAYLAQCHNMIRDIRDGVDFHCKRLAYAEGMDYETVFQKCNTSEEWQHKRKKAKPISFQKAYGAHPTSIAKSTGLSLETVERVFNQEDLEYPEIAQYYKGVTECIKNTRVPTVNLLYIKDKRSGMTITKPNEFQGIGYYQSITGKRYHFMERGAWTIRNDVWRYFSGPEICDFPVQGTAADIVSMQVGRLWRWLLTQREKCVLINEVHDEVVLDCRTEYVEEVKAKVKEIMEDVDGSFQKYLGIRFNVPIRVEINNGDTWGDAK